MSTSSHTPRLRSIVSASIAVLALVAMAGCSSSASPGASTGGAAGAGAVSAALYKGSESAPPPTSPPVAKNKSVWWISCGQSDLGCSGKAAGGEAAAKALGWDFHIADGNYGIADGYGTAIRTALAASPSAIVADAFSCETVKQPLLEAKAQGVAVIGLEALDCPDQKLFTVDMLYNDKVSTQEDWWREYGTLSARYITEKSGGTAKIIENDPHGTPTLELLTEGFNTEIAKCTGCTIVQKVPFTLNDISPNGAWIQAFRAALVKHPDATAAYFPFDVLAGTLGGAKAVKDAGLSLTTFGGNGVAETLDLVPSGLWTATSSARSLDWLGWGAMDELNRSFNGQPAAVEGIGKVVVDADHNLPAKRGSNYVTSVDYKSAYLKAWGLQ